MMLTLLDGVETVALKHDQPDYPILKVRNAAASAQIALQGATVFSFIPADQHDLLWLSKTAEFNGDKSIRGGVPVCWPWFAEFPEQRDDRPKHGLVRNRPTRLVGLEETSDETVLVFEFDTALDAKDINFPSSKATIEIVIGKALHITLTTKNQSDQPVHYTAALHSYLQVGDVHTLYIEGFTGANYRDKLQGFERLPQTDALQVRGEIDRVYELADAPKTNQVFLHDDALARTVSVAKGGCNSLVVWNPGQELAASLGDFDEARYRQMLCVEAGKVLDDGFELAPGESFSFSTTISATPL